MMHELHYHKIYDKLVISHTNKKIHHIQKNSAFFCRPVCDSFVHFLKTYKRNQSLYCSRFADKNVELCLTKSRLDKVFDYRPIGKPLSHLDCKSFPTGSVPSGSRSHLTHFLGTLLFTQQVLAPCMSTTKRQFRFFKLLFFVLGNRFLTFYAVSFHNFAHFSLN